MIPAYEPLLLSYGTASEQWRVAATILWRSAADAVSYGPDEDGLASALTAPAGARPGVGTGARVAASDSFTPRTKYT